MEVLASEAPHEPQALPALVPPQILALPPPEGPQMQDVAAEEEQALLAQDESSGSSASEPWEEPEDPHPPEKRVHRSSPDYDPTEDLPKTYERRRKKTRRMTEDTLVSAAAHNEEHKAQTITGPSE